METYRIGLKSQKGAFAGRRLVVRYTGLVSNKGLLVVIVAVIVTAAGVGIYVASPQGSPGGTSSASHSSTTSHSTPVGPALLTLSGTISATGSGTRASLVTFSGGSGNFTAVVTSGTYKVTLANGEEYSVEVYWNGTHPWQSGRVRAGVYDANQSASPVATKDWEVATPASDITVSGTVSTTGMATKATRLVLTSNRTSALSVAVTNGQYSAVLPNEVAYGVSVSWSGAYSWQTGNATRQLVLNVSSGSADQKDFAGILTPDSNVTVTGSVSTTGEGTYPTNLVFTSSNTGYTYASVSNRLYQISLPNGVNYSVEVAWHGAYAWQSGVDLWQGGKLVTVNASAGETGPMTEDFALPTPDSNATVTGFVHTTGVDTFPASVTFAGRGGSYVFSVVGPDITVYYNLTLPNIDSYNVTIAWNGIKPWQTGSQGFSELVNVGAGGSPDVSNYTINTPPSWASVSGHVTTSLGSAPWHIDFYLADGTWVSGVNVDSNGHYYDRMPTGTVYDVVVLWQSIFTKGECSAGELYLTAPIVSSYTADFSC